MTKMQLQSKIGIFNVGNSFMSAATTNTKSATESNAELKAVTDFAFLAMVPSIISVKPQSRYNK